LRISGSIGSEAGVLSIGSGSGIDHLAVVATYVDRYKREKDIWEIAKSLREKIAKIPNIKYLEVSPYGATAMSSIKATVDAKLSSGDISQLPEAGQMVENALSKTKGVVSTSITWDMGKRVYNLKIDETKGLEYGLSRFDIVAQLKLALRGKPVATFPKRNSIDYTVRVWRQIVK